MISFKSVVQLDSEGWNNDQLTEQICALDDGYDISHLDAAKWGAAQMEQQRIALRDGLDFVGTIHDQNWAELTPQRADGRSFTGCDPERSEERHLRVCRLAHSYGLDLSGLTAKVWTSNKMYEQMMALRLGVDISHLVHAQWGTFQLQQQREAIKCGLDLSNLDPVQVTVEQMVVHREKLLEQCSGLSSSIDVESGQRPSR